MGLGEPSGMNCVLVERLVPKIVTNSPRATAGGTFPTDDAALTKPWAVNDGACPCSSPAHNSASPQNRPEIRPVYRAVFIGPSQPRAQVLIIHCQRLRSGNIFSLNEINYRGHS